MQKNASNSSVIVVKREPLT